MGGDLILTKPDRMSPSQKQVGEEQICSNMDDSSQTFDVKKLTFDVKKQTLEACGIQKQTCDVYVEDHPFDNFAFDQGIRCRRIGKNSGHDFSSDLIDQGLRNNTVTSEYDSKSKKPQLLHLHK